MLGSMFLFSGLTQQQVLNLLEHPTSKDYVVLAKGVSAPNQTKIAALNIPGVASSPAYARDYPDGDATANVVGFTNVNPATGVIAGQTGLEQEYNKLLSGTPGSEQVEIGADGQPIPLAGSKDTPAKNGTGIRLTIIPALQLAAQQACEAGGRAQFPRPRMLPACLPGKPGRATAGFRTPTPCS